MYKFGTSVVIFFFLAIVGCKETPSSAPQETGTNQESVQSKGVTEGGATKTKDKKLEQVPEQPEVGNKEPEPAGEVTAKQPESGKPEVSKAQDKEQQSDGSTAEFSSNEEPGCIAKIEQEEERVKKNALPMMQKQAESRDILLTWIEKSYVVFHEEEGKALSIQRAKLKEEASKCMSKKQELFSGSLSKVFLAGKVEACARFSGKDTQALCKELVTVSTFLDLVVTALSNKESDASDVCSKAYWMPFNSNVEKRVVLVTDKQSNEIHLDYSFSDHVEDFVQHRSICRTLFKSQSCKVASLESIYRKEILVGVKFCDAFQSRLRGEKNIPSFNDSILDAFLEQIPEGGLTEDKMEVLPQQLASQLFIPSYNPAQVLKLNCADLISGEPVWPLEQLSAECTILDMVKKKQPLRCDGRFEPDSVECLVMETIHNYLERKSEVGKAETKKVAAGPMHRQSSGPGTMHRQPLGSGPRRGPSQGPGMKRFPDADNELPSNHAVYEHLRKHRATLQQLVAVLKLSANAALIPSSFSSLTMSGCAIKKDPGERKICEWLVRIPVWMRVMQMGKEGPKDGLCAMSFWMPFGWPATSGLASGTVQFAEMFVMYVKYRAYCRAVFQADSCDETELEEAYQLELKNGVKNCQNMVVRIKDGAIETPPSDPELKKFLTDISPGGFSTTSTNGAPAHDVPFSLSHVNSDALEALNCKDIVDGSMLWSPELMPIECQLTALKKSGKALQCKGNFPDDSAACKLLGLHSQFGYKKGSKQNQKLRGMPEFKVGAVQKEGPMMDDREFRGRFFDEVRSGTSLAAVAVRKHFLAPDDCYSILLRHYMLPAMGRRVELRVVVNNVHDLSTECKITAVAKGRIRSEQQQFLPLSGGATGYVNYFYPAKEELEYEVTAECDWADLLVVSEPEKAGEDTPATGKNPGKTVVNE